MASRRSSLQRLVGHKIAVTSDIRPHWRLAPVMPALVAQPELLTSGTSNIVDLREYGLRMSDRRTASQEDS
jgi:hypothetical protein